MATVNLRIGPADNGRRMTVDEFRKAEEQPGYLYELARGVLEVTEVPGDDHGQILRDSSLISTRFSRDSTWCLSGLGLRLAVFDGF